MIQNAHADQQDVDAMPMCRQWGFANGALATCKTHTPKILDPDPMDYSRANNPRDIQGSKRQSARDVRTLFIPALLKRSHGFLFPTVASTVSRSWWGERRGSAAVSGLSAVRRMRAATELCAAIFAGDAVVATRGGVNSHFLPHNRLLAAKWFPACSRTLAATGRAAAL